LFSRIDDPAAVGSLKGIYQLVKMTGIQLDLVYIYICRKKRADHHHPGAVYPIVLYGRQLLGPGSLRPGYDQYDSGNKCPKKEDMGFHAKDFPLYKTLKGLTCC
jgi:hypothetical protein